MSLESWPYTGDDPHLYGVGDKYPGRCTYCTSPFSRRNEDGPTIEPYFQSGVLDSTRLPLSLERPIDLDLFSWLVNH